MSMTAEELKAMVMRHREKAKNWTREEHLKFLQEAKILDENGDYDERFFDPEINRLEREAQRLKAEAQRKGK